MVDLWDRTLVACSFWLLYKAYEPFFKWTLPKINTAVLHFNTCSTLKKGVDCGVRRNKSLFFLWLGEIRQPKARRVLSDETLIFRLAGERKSFREIWDTFLACLSGSFGRLETSNRRIKEKHRQVPSVLIQSKWAPTSLLSTDWRILQFYSLWASLKSKTC